ncbi:hypothetical protein BpHYR1_042686 [Brachionus plicatilis]|uniref:Uncharacterized protein n=1 Tax=Brachionus plicatilis TaxID=10195 RepID=A0A3M7QQ50_BRAPC|nr:hypothetical protein BpHYR1_042686 [Brachionus plicatilis]
MKNLINSKSNRIPLINRSRIVCQDTNSLTTESYLTESCVKGLLQLVIYRAYSMFFTSITATYKNYNY